MKQKINIDAPSPLHELTYKKYRCDVNLNDKLVPPSLDEGLFIHEQRQIR